MRRLHLVFKTHLDIGFTKLAHEVVESYLERYIPSAIALARALAAGGGRERFIWTTGSWLISEALERYRGERLRDLELALGEGHLAWHGLPFTTHTEYLDAGLVRHGLSLSQALDRRFGRTTVAAKMTDVPGHTAALVPLLAEAGIRFLHLGVNPASRVPSVPEAFRWRHAGAEVAVLYARDYGGTAVLPGLDEGLAFGHTGDNHGPQGPDEVRHQFSALRERFPDTEVVASTLDAFARILAPIHDKLPLVEDEIGDSWIHGVGTDPAKTADFRALARWRSATIAANPSLAGRRDLRRFSTRLLLVGEHTWGRDLKHWAPGGSQLTGSFDPATFAAERAAGVHDRWEESWQEQRAYLDEAVACLAGGPLHAAAQAARVRTPLERDWTALPAGATARLEHDGDAIELDPASGAVVRCTLAGRNLAGSLGCLRYQVFGADDYARFIAAYNPNFAGTRSWAVADFGKPGLETVQAHGAAWTPQVERLEQAADALRVHLTFPTAAAQALGCPARWTLTWRLAAGTLHAELAWSGKRACRIPEALWFGFTTALDPAGWRLRKLGSTIDPRRIVPGGNPRLHAVQSAEHSDGLVFTTPDAALLAPGRPRLVDADDTPADSADGLHVNLWNNTWGTNFPMWTDEDAWFRFAWAWRE